MVHSADIGMELKGISEVVAGLPPVTPFVVPEGFFAHFPEKVLTLVRSLEGGAEEVGPMLSPGLRDRITLQAPPPGYFEGFAENMMQRIRAEEAGSLAENGSLAAAAGPARAEAPETPALLEDLRRAATFQAPKGYFEGLPERMLARAKAADAMTAPQGNEAPQDVDEELRELSPLLASYPRVYPGTVPAGYFEAFDPMRVGTPVVVMPEKATPETASGTGARVLPITGSRSSVRQILAAAVTVGVMLTSGVWGYHIYLRPSSDVQNEINLKSPDQLNSALAKVSDQAIIDYLKSNTDVSDAELIASEVDDQQLQNAVDNGKTDNDSKASE
ncbi:MAG TPA: hypothetical protein VL547_19015 [Dinghuibacter sp.]|uniref:hypothetical protein n=1 Tax=Dinghuibacter sp. TaxID=2024697 RepID=UPI002BDD31B5|nr:hypothetical protein [Dinghuibacter sp.]HTJ14141.1 hypothetical protein [Dinghuibacter sp.]